MGFEEPKHRIIRDKGQEFFKNKQYREAYELFKKSYQMSFNQYGSSISVYRMLIKTSMLLGDHTLLKIWLDEFDNLKKFEDDWDFKVFGRVQVLISIKKYSDAIVELNRIGVSKLEFYGHHLSIQIKNLRSQTL